MLYKRTITQRLLAILLAITMMIGLIPQSAFATSSGWVTRSETTTAEMQAVADDLSIYTYRDIFDDVKTEEGTTQKVYSTQHTGRIWADKSVNDDEDGTTFIGQLTPVDNTDDKVTTGTTSDGQNTATINMNAKAQFQTTFSTMATTSNVVNQTSAPMDLVLVIDLSPMSNSEDKKVNNLLTAVEGAINTALSQTDENDNNVGNRVAVVAYSNQAEELLPLGHYDTVDLSFSGEAKKGGNVTCTYSTTADKSESSEPFPIATTAGSGVNKYTQYGIYKGMQILKTAGEAQNNALSGNPESDEVRQPVMILLSEGDPKIASTHITEPTPSLIGADGWTGFRNTVAYSGEKWPLNRPDTAEGTDGYEKGGVEILRNYGLADNNGSINANNRHAQAFATLLTAAYAKEEVTKAYYGSDNEHNNAMRFYTVGINMNTANAPELGAMALNPRAQLNGNTTLGSAFVGYATDFFNNKTVNIKDAGSNDHTTTFTLADSGLDGTGVNNIEALRYNDMYFDVRGGASPDFGDVFDQIFTNIKTEGAQGATYVDGDSAESGYITYTDPLGKYMEVKSMDALILNNKIYTKVTESKSQSGNTTTYTFKNTDSGGQATGALDNPVYGNSYGIDKIQITVTTEDNAQTVEVKVPAALIPLRLTEVDLTKDDNGKIFDSNDAYPLRLVYSVGLQEELLDNRQLKANSALEKDTEYLKDTGEYDESKRTVTFYEGQYSGEKIEESISNGDTSVPNPTRGDAYVEYVPAANNPFYYLTQEIPVYTDSGCSTKLKASSSIDPNETYYFRVPYYSSDNENPTELKYDAPISRPGKLLKNDYIKQGTDGVYLVPGTPRMTTLSQYTTLKGANTADSTITEDDNKKANGSQTTNIRMYPTYVKYDGTQHSQPGNITFCLYLGNNGKLTVPVADNFNVPESAVLDGEDNLTITKVVDGGEWPENESFTFKITAETENAPMPKNTTITIDKPTSGDSNTGSFGNITFDTEGVYKYTITEEPGNNRDINYDDRTLTVTVKVTKNEETGNLEAMATFADNDDKDNTDPKTFYNTVKKNEPTPPSNDQPSTDDPDTPGHNPGTPGGTTPEQPGGDEPTDPDQPLDPDGPDDLNTVDHFYYIVGYPEDYRTGAVTDDESLWPIKPQGKITRAEVATIFYRLLKKDVREANTTTQNNFSDVSADDWYGTTVSTLAHMGIIAGYEDGSFRPNAPITRAEFAAIAARFFENTDVDYPAGLFTDIAGDEWYADIVAAAAELGLIGGYPDGTMRPLASISRAEACAIVNRTIERHPDEDHLVDSADMRTWPDNLPGAWYYADMQEATNGHEYTWLNDEHTSEAWTEVIPDFDWSKR